MNLPPITGQRNRLSVHEQPAVVRASYCSGLLWASTIALALLGAFWWAQTAPHAVFNLRPNSAVDLIARHRQIADLFAGNPVYEARNAVYPPAAYITLWPFVGWASIGVARWTWLLISLASVVGLGLLTVRLALPSSPAERWFLALIPFSMHATGGTLRFGQVTLLVMLALIAALVLLRRPATWPRDLGIMLLMTIALIKPTIAAPFFWLILFLPKSLRPALLVAALYLGLTLAAASLQATSPILLIEQWIDNALSGATHAATGVNSVNQQGVFQMLNLPDLDFAIALTMLLGVGGWVAWRRRADPWLLVGLVAIVARLWTYHAGYDNLLLLLPLIVLYRIYKQTSNRQIAILAILLFTLGVLSTVAPGHTYLPSLLKTVYGFGQFILWTAMAVFFGWLSLPGHSAAPNRAQLRRLLVDT